MTDKKKTPARPSSIIRRDVLAFVFEEWARRYYADPSQFADLLADDPQDPRTYGERCADYVFTLAKEIVE